MKKEPHLKFTDQELAENTPVGNAARKAKKAAERADKADAKIPRRKKPKVALHFDDEVKRPKEVKAPREKARGRKKQDAEKQFRSLLKNHPPKVSSSPSVLRNSRNRRQSHPSVPGMHPEE